MMIFVDRFRSRCLALVLCLVVLYPFTGMAGTPWKFVVFGDSRGTQSNSGVNEPILGKLALAIRDDHPEFILFVGDQVFGHAERRSGDSLGLARLRTELTTWLKTMKPVYDAGIRVYNVRGNHESTQRYPDPRPVWPATLAVWDSVFQGPYANPANGPAGEKNVTFYAVHHNALIIGMDLYSTPVANAPVNADGSINHQYFHRVNQSWLDTVLAAHPQQHVFAFTHEPAFKVAHADCLQGDKSIGVDYSRERDAFWRSLKRAGGVAYFAGHDHGYVHDRIDDGDNNRDNDLHQYVVGTGGAGKDTDPVYDGYNGAFTPVDMYHENSYGYLLVEVDSLNVKLTWKHMTSEATGVCSDQEIFTYTAGQTTTSAPERGNGPSGYRLYENYPNPFNPETTIGFSVPRQERARLDVYDVTGNVVMHLMDGVVPAGVHTVVWNGCHQDQSPAPSGMYMYRLMTDEFTSTRSMMLIR